MRSHDVEKTDLDTLLTIASFADRAREIETKDKNLNRTASHVQELVSGLRIDKKLTPDNCHDLRWLNLLTTHINHDNNAIDAYKKLVELYFFWLKDAANAIPYLLYGLSLKPNEKALKKYYREICEYLNVSKLKVAFFYDNRIGHFCMEFMEYQLNSSAYKNQYTVFISSEQPANKLLLKKFSEKIPIILSNTLYKIHTSSEWIKKSYIQPLIGNQVCWHKSWHPKQSNLKDYFQLFELDKENRDDLINFTAGEIDYCEEILLNMGIKGGSRSDYVCLNSRSNHYLFEHAKERNGVLTQETAASLEFRNSTLSNYSKAVQYLIDKGTYVVTVGSHLYGDLNVDSEFLIDYSNIYRDNVDYELLDLYILSHARFFICNHSGITDLAAMNKTPLLIVNAAPIQPPYHARDMYIPKLIIDANSGKPAPYPIFYDELNDSSLKDGEKLIFCPDGDELLNRGYYYQENSEKCILNAVIDMDNRTKDNRVFDDQQTDLIKAHWNLIPTSHWMSRVKVPIAPSFLLQHHNLFF